MDAVFAYTPPHATTLGTIYTHTLGDVPEDSEDNDRYFTDVGVGVEEDEDK
ncbi:hypothetical protein ACWFMI_23180 [Nocardiopsis terrae]|uniref:hypothetical protein n=1 Tax=Streptomyces sp. NPDC057554 TaxID=3350538 RepID=UPI0036CCFB0A